MKSFLTSALAATALTASIASPALAADPEDCASPRFSEVGWTDIQATTGAASLVLTALGYTPDVKNTSVPLTFVGLEQGDLDVFLGLWMPSMKGMVEEKLKDAAFDDLHTNLEGAKYTLVVPRYVYDAGVKDITDLDAHKDQFGGKIYGIEPGNDGNLLIQQMIDADAFGLGDWQLVESSEAGMLLQAKGATEGKEWITFLGWAPHPMNTKMEINYLTGADEYFGPNQGGATVHTLVRHGYAEACPNVAQFLKNLSFTVESESIIMGGIMDHKLDAEEAAKTFLAANPAMIEPWLEGVTTLDGKPGLPAVKAALGIK
ncbi:choline ABC transporter substrate-binding protein [Rhodospirillum sp. A1_3_36]|uniref:choline ABC transporter substrate-binding protein n=1 Tax=Rhodospirillum sp. A1_3_36 TaxID=3391666 RepID=UPI0039A5C438